MPDNCTLLILNIGDPSRPASARSQVLRDAGLTVHEATTGEQGLQMALAERPSLILLDEHLPDMSGDQVLARLKTEPTLASSLVLQTVSAGSAQARVHALTVGADAFLSEPFEPQELVATVQALLRRVRTEQEHARILESEHAARSAAEEAQARLAFLAEASAILATSLDYETTLASVARLAIARIADWCSIHLLEEDGSLRLVELAHANATTAQWAREFSERFPVDMNSRAGPGNVIRTGKAEFYPELPDSLLIALARSEDELSSLRQFGFRAAMVVPLMGHEQRPLGAITLLSAESGRVYSPADLSLAEELAHHAALAIENARLYHESQSAVKARDMFLSVATHELKTPLTIIQGYAELLKRQIDKAVSQAPTGDPATDVIPLPRGQVLHRVENVYAATERLTRLINELLDVNRMQRGALELNREQLNLSALLTSVVQNVIARDLAAEKPRNVQIHVDCPPDPVIGYWDHSRIEQVLVNLIDNAIKYSPPDSTVQVVLTVEPANNEELSAQLQAHVMVRDQGIGIPPEELGRIFQPFMRATNAARMHLPGLGLGLAITREIVEHHGGRIWVESEGLNRGTAFHVILPGVEAAESEK